MSKKSIEGQIDLFSLWDDDNNEEMPVFSTEDSRINETEVEIITDIDKDIITEVATQAEEITKSTAESQQELELEEGDIIWAIVDKKLESHIVTKAQKDHCITKSEDGQTRRLTMRSKGICWEYTREKAQELQEKNKY